MICHVITGMAVIGFTKGNVRIQRTLGHLSAKGPVQHTGSLATGERSS